MKKHYKENKQSFMKQHSKQFTIIFASFLQNLVSQEGNKGSFWMLQQEQVNNKQDNATGKHELAIKD